MPMARQYASPSSPAPFPTRLPTPTDEGGTVCPGPRTAGGSTRLGASPRSISAHVLGVSLGAADPGELDSLHVELALAVAELSAAAGRQWCWGPDDPVVALVRAVAMLMVEHPDTPTRHGARLVAALQVDRG